LKLFASLIIVLGFIHAYVAITTIQSETFLYWQSTIIYIQLIVEIFIFFQIAIMIWSYAGIVHYNDNYKTLEDLTEYPDIDVFIPIRNGSAKYLEETIIALKNQDYPQEKVHIIVADDTPNQELANLYKSITLRHDVKLIYDNSNSKFKAGMLNIALKFANSKYVCFFDHDQIPAQGILKHFINILEHNPQYSFVQAKKMFKDLHNLSRVWSALLYLQFFEIMEKLKQNSKSVFFAGSTACFRRNAINLVGGMPEDTFTEDNELTIRLLLLGSIGTFTNKIGSLGTVPDGFVNQVAQLWRWSHGGTNVLSLYGLPVIKSKKLSIAQKIDIIATLSITPILVCVYIYSISFIPLIITGVDSPRLVIGTFSSLAIIPIIISSTYIILATLAVVFSKEDERSEFKLSHLPGFFLIGLANNILILSSGIFGLLRKLGPKSKRGLWMRDIKVIQISFIGLIIGLIVEYFAINWFLDGFYSAILLILVSSTLLPTFFIALYYVKIKP